MRSQPADAGELRLFLEELCCDLCRRKHVETDGMAPEDIKIGREVQLAAPGEFADIVVTLPSAPSYFVEIKYGHPLEETVRNIRRKYAANYRPACNRLIVVTRDLDPAILQSRLRECVCSTLDIEVIGEPQLLEFLKKYYGIDSTGLAGVDMTTLHSAMLRANWNIAFAEDYYEILASALLWHFSPWTLKRLHDQAGLGPGDIWQIDSYRDVAVVMADLSGFSAYVRDTPDERVMQQVLTAFYSYARQAVHEYGGMFYQFVGDEVVGLFGFPDRKSGYIADALNCAKALLDVGASTSVHWQRRIDRAQPKQGVHIGIAMGSLNLLPLRPFARSHIGFIGDALNLTARLMAVANPGEIVASNAFHAALDEDMQAEFAENRPVKAKNVGAIKSWRRVPFA
jgi:adenylate cyclase